ncbi:DUF4142 domain-containing protein [Methylorubrum thiocyanatum]|uniref:DUF4142 domain-containing protein n=1 Tax=Methylorubrum thiocyanatum TaxID=47958 RepID=UPI00383B4C08
MKKAVPCLSTLALALAVSATALTPASAQDALVPGLLPLSSASPAVHTGVFRAEVLRGDAYSIEASRMALARSNNPKVRNLAGKVITNRQATTDALLPPGTSLTPGGIVVADAGRGTVDTPLGLIGAPIAVVGGVVGAVTGTAPAVVDNRPSEPGKRVALDPARQKRIADLGATSGHAFDRTYARQQAVADAETVKLYQAYAQSGDSAAGRQFARQAVPLLQDERDDAAAVHDRMADEDDAVF